MPTKTARPKRTRKLGKAQERRLHFALSIDDLLYRKWQRMKEDFDLAVARFQRQKRVVQVVGRRHGADYGEALQILGAYPGPDGMLVVVRLPPGKTGGGK